MIFVYVTSLATCVRWQGIGAVLDVSNEAAVMWYVGRLRKFQQTFRIESFKFDSGEVCFLPRRRATERGRNSNEYSTMYANMAALFGRGIEVRRLLHNTLGSLSSISHSFELEVQQNTAPGHVSAHFGRRPRFWIGSFEDLLELSNKKRLHLI